MPNIDKELEGKMEKEDSIELIDLLRIFWKWKRFIVIFTFACVLIVGIISILMQEMYDVSMIIEPGVIDIDRDGEFIYLDSSLNIKSKIDSQAYNNRIFKALHITPEEMELTFRTIQHDSSKTIKIRFEVNDANKGIKVLSALFDELRKEYQNYVDSRKLELKQKIAMNSHTLHHRNNEKNHLEEEINKVKANTDRIIEERSTLLNKGINSEDRLSLLIYTNIIQQNMEHYSDLNSDLGKLMAEIEKVKAEMETLKIKMESIENIKVIQTPQSSFYPVKPKKLINIILAFVIGGIVSIVLAFFLEYIQKMNSIETKS